MFIILNTIIQVTPRVLLIVFVVIKNKQLMISTAEWVPYLFYAFLQMLMFNNIKSLPGEEGFNYNQVLITGQDLRGKNMACHYQGKHLPPLRSLQYWTITL
jgi:hypothetical protein